MSWPGKLEQSFVIEELEQPITLDSSELAREIKNYRCIFDNFLRRDQSVISQAWDNVCAKMLPNFATMTSNQQIASKKRLRDRWSYMRATYRRDVFNNRLESHNYLNWIKEMDFLLPILNKSTNKDKISKTTWRSGKNKRLLKSKEPASSSTIKTGCYTSQQSPTIDNATAVSNPIVNNESSVAGCSNATAMVTATPSKPVAEATSPISDAIVLCDSSDSDESDMNTSTNTTKTTTTTTTSTTESTKENKIENDLLIDAFVSTFSLESFFKSTIDPDQIFLLTLLQNYRLVNDEKKEALQHKFYTFLRD